MLTKVPRENRFKCYVNLKCETMNSEGAITLSWKVY